MISGCYPSVKHYLGVAEEELTQEEIGAVQSIAMAVAAGKVKAELGDIRDRMKK